MRPRLLTTDYFILYTFGVFMLVAFLVALWWVMRSARQREFNTRSVLFLSLWMMGGGLVGAKLLAISRLLLQYSSSHSLSSSSLAGAGDFYGGFLGALVVATIYFRRNPDLPAWRVADLYGPAVALGHAIGRIGCLMAGDDFGTPTHLPWSVAFTDPEASLIGGAPLGIPLHPVQLYESLVCLGLFFFLVWLSRRQRFDGEIILAYAFGYAIFRFIIEFFRGDLDRGFVFWGRLSTSQFIALLIAGTSWIMMVRRARNHNRQQQHL